MGRGEGQEDGTLAFGSYRTDWKERYPIARGGLGEGGALAEGGHELDDVRNGHGMKII